MLFEKCFVGSYCRSKRSRFVTDKYGCYLCWSNFNDSSTFQSHMKHHSKDVKVGGFNAIWKSLGNLQLIEFNIAVNESDLNLILKNNSNSIVKISHVAVYNTISTFDSVSPSASPIILTAGEEVTFKRNFNQLDSRNHIAIVYETNGNNVSETVQSYHIQLPTSKPPPIRADPPASPETKRSLELGKLLNYDPSVEIKSLCRARFNKGSELTANEAKLLDKITQFKGPLTSANYFEMQSTMVQIEDFCTQLSIMRSTKRNRSLLKVKGNEYVLKLNEREGRPLFLLAGDRIWIEGPKTRSRTYGFVQHVSSSEIRMKLRTSNGIVQREPIHSLHFEFNRLTFQLQHLALDTAKQLAVIDLLFPQQNLLNLLNEPMIPKLDIHNKRLKGDVAQVEAVGHMVAGSAYPFPYVLIGFPGTGKTATIVESIYQLWKISPKHRILVCAQSNAVCDEIAQRLVAIIPTKCELQYNIIRLFAASVRRSCNNEELLENSNFSERCIPCLPELYKYRIVVSTLTVSGRLLQAKMDATHFTHLFIDECESATEAFTLLPIALCSSSNKINAHVVLSGDPHQLGPVVREDVTRKMTMDISMFNRLCSDRLYQTNDRRITCKLRNNYRSHPELVRMPNELFYNNKMRCSIPNIEKIEWLSELDFLPKKGFPILFEHVNGNAEKKDECSSWYNEIEAESVLHYIDTLLGNEPLRIKQSDIGVIAAYKRQVIHISETLEQRNYDGIEVGTVEQFQGREKLIVIISTVRKGSLGFLQQWERINVLLTRAIGLLIIIGHTKTLHKNSNWTKIVRYTSTKCGGEVVAEYC